MFRTLIFLVGTAILAALMAGVYYAPNTLALREEATAYNPGPGEVRQDTVHASLPGSDIVYEVEVLEGAVDIYVMDQEWVGSLAQGGDIHLDRPFNYYAEWSAVGVNGTHTFTIQSDGRTSYSVVFDNSDNYYQGDADEEEGERSTAKIRTTVRFVEEEGRSLTFGYLAAIPSVLLVVVTFGRQYWRHHRDKRLAARGDPPKRGGPRSRGDG